MKFKLPEGWKKVGLKEVINLKHGYGFKGVDFSDTPTNRVLVTPGNFKIGGGYTDSKLKFYREDIELNSEFVLSRDDVIVTMTDLSKNIDTLGYSALVPDNKYIYLHNQRIGLIVIKEEAEKTISKYYLYWLMRSCDYQKYIANTSTGTTVHHTAPKTILSYEFNLPTLPEQKIIADTLSSLDNKIALNNEINKNLETQAQAIFKHWFVDFQFPDENGNPYRSSGGEMIESELGMIPKGWGVKEIKDICQITSSKRIFRKEYSETGIPFLRGKEIIEKSKGNAISTELFITTEKYNTIKAKFSVPKEKDILLTSVGTLGVSYQVGKEEFYFKDGNITWFKDFKKDEYKNYVYMFLNSNLGKQELNKITIGSTQKALTISALKEIPIILPDSILLDRFDTMTSSILDKMNNNNLQNQTLAQLRDTLLPKLMSGELRIPLD